MVDAAPGRKKMFPRNHSLTPSRVPVARGRILLSLALPQGAIQSNRDLPSLEHQGLVTSEPRPWPTVCANLRAWPAKRELAHPLAYNPSPFPTWQDMCMPGSRAPSNHCTTGCQLGVVMGPSLHPKNTH